VRESRVALLHRPRENEGVIALTEPQTWVLIGIFGAAIFSTIGLQTASFNRNLTTAIGALRESMEGKLDGIRGELTGFKGEVNARFDAVNARFDALDRDVQVLSRRAFGADS
jgi:hypothetical protein